MHRAEAFLNIHDPVSTKEFHRAIATLRYEEAFVCQTALLQARAHAGRASAEPCPDVTLRDAMIASLPFSLTGGQREVIDSIAADMSREHRTPSDDASGLRDHGRCESGMCGRSGPGQACR